MSEDTITVNMNVYDIPIVVEQLNKLEQENNQLKEVIEEIREYVKNNDNFELADLYSRSIADEIQNKLLQILDKATKENE